MGVILPRLTVGGIKPVGSEDGPQFSIERAEQEIKMEYPYHIGFLDPATYQHFNPDEPQYPYPYNQPSDTSLPGNVLPNLETCPASVRRQSIGFEETAAQFCHVAPPQVSYGFQTSNWFEEQQSWFPQPPPQPFADGPLDGATTEPFVSQQGSWGIRIGFENFEESGLNDPTIHYHAINSYAHNDPSVCSAAAPKGLRRSYTIHEEARSSGFSTDTRLPDSKLTRSRSVSGRGYYPSPPVSPADLPETGWRVQLLETPPNCDTSLAAFCNAVKSVRSRYSASDGESNPGIIWSVAFRFMGDVDEESEMEITVFGDRLQHPLRFTQKDNDIVEDVIEKILTSINQFPPPHDMPPHIPSLYPPLPAQASYTHSHYPQPQDPYVPHQPHQVPQNLYPSLQSLEMPTPNQYPPSDPHYPPTPASLPPLHPPHSHSPLDPTLLNQLQLDPPGKKSLMSICGLDEYLQMEYSLRSHKNLQRLSSVQLRFHHGPPAPAQPPCLARTPEDDEAELNPSKFGEHAQYWTEIRKRLFGSVARYTEQAQYFLRSQVHVQVLLEAVKEICFLLRSVETKEVKNARRSLTHLIAQKCPDSRSLPADPGVEAAVINLSNAVSDLIDMYGRSFQMDFRVAPGRTPGLHADGRPADPNLTFNLYAVHNLPKNWVESDNVYFVSCSVVYAGRKICQEVTTRRQTAARDSFSAVLWDERICFPVVLSSLPYESALVLRLMGVKESPAAVSLLAWSCLPLYCSQRMVHGNMLLNMVSHVEPPPVITPGAFDVTLPTLLTAQVDFMDNNGVFQKPPPEAPPQSGRIPFPEASGDLEKLIHRNSVLFLSEAEKRSLWRHRSCSDKPEKILPLLLGSAPGWDPQTVSAIYRVLQDWEFSDPTEALGLLNSCFPDQQIRNVACQQIGKLSNDELLEYLPQLVQAVKSEWRPENPLVDLLLNRALQSIQVAHRLYWLLTDAANESRYRSLYRRVLAALRFCVGKAMNEEFVKQEKLMEILQNISEKVKAAQDTKRQEILQSNLSDLEQFFRAVRVLRLPQDPALVVRGIDRSKCSYFKSNAVPLKISFVNADPLGENIDVIFKSGDDLRQDMLVLQLIEVMDRLWLQEGLDLRMVTYKCLSTGKKQGLLQMVPNSMTLAKIHKQFGILSPLKEGTLHKWFAEKPTDSSGKASENFLYSCAGWCVATFLLGVCDRHNDNIMVTDAGHMFHIDFGKFLGHAQKFGSIKRDRAPFIFTPEMEYFITDGGRDPPRSREFVDLCCCAFAILRKHSALLINLLELMLQAGLPELRDLQDLSYVQNNLRPQDSDLEATRYFTKKIKESLECLPVQLNYIIHNFANSSVSDTAAQIKRSILKPKKFLKGAIKPRKLRAKSDGFLITADNKAHPLKYGRSLQAFDSRPGVQLRLSFKEPELSILVQHLRNINLPAASMEISLVSDLHATQVKKVNSFSRSSALFFNEIVKFFVDQNRRYVLTLLVRSREAIVAAANIPLDAVPFNEDTWCPLSLQSCIQ
ncbi:phosphatidylinositol 3-kinase C2 domain-containing subunit gamma [Spea bombifrons]|uniref:phosphatidylinositol 3-kinase C2 domain-containing subunit gamma n=1 Tax=Spea bombifrons TaxID=233779 RepID=UPI00234B7665|nr:phosphatidylinositol 3-kinase C2 domain-containing subunit gamma [Spea bombifrons]